MKILKEWGPFIGLFTIIILLRIFIVAPVRVSGHSMDPTLADKQYLLSFKTSQINRFDIVTAKEIDESGETKAIVKRVIGLPGDRISYANDVLTINGKVYAEPYLDNYQKKFKADKLQETYSFKADYQARAQAAPAFTFDKTWQANFTVTVPEGCYYLLGDNRIISSDSREVGCFKASDITGEAKFRFWPVKAIGQLK
jgi:signal peptidase I